MWRREVANLASPQVNAGPFARAFPAADFYAVDQQYSFPLPLPAVFLGLPSWTKPLPRSSEGLDATWLGGEFEHAVLTVKPGPGSYFQDAAPPTPPPSLASQQRTFRDVSSVGRRALPQAVQDAPALRRGALGDGGAASHPDERPRVRACAALPRARRQMPNTTCKPESALTCTCYMHVHVACRTPGRDETARDSIYTLPGPTRRCPRTRRATTRSSSSPTPPPTGAKGGGGSCCCSTSSSPGQPRCVLPWLPSPDSVPRLRSQRSRRPYASTQRRAAGCVGLLSHAPTPCWPGSEA